MKKSNILIAVVVLVVAMGSEAKAATAGVGYDVNKLNTLRSENFDTAGGRNKGDMFISIPGLGKPTPVIASDTTSDLIFSSDKDAMEKHLDWYIKVAISYSETTGQLNVKNNLIKLLQKGTLEEKYAFVYNKGEVYEFPERFITRYPGQQICVASHQEQECVNQLVCRMVCAAGGAAAGGVAGAVGATVCNQVCESVPKCSNVTVCDQYVTEPMNHGQDSHGNWE